MATQWALVGNIVIACAYAAITMAILVPVVRAGQLRTNRLATTTALIFFSCAVGHALHAAMYWHASFQPAAMAGMHETAGWSLWPTAAWDLFTAAVGVYYWTLRRSYGILLGGTGALFVDPAEQQRRHDIELRERVAEGRAEAESERDAQAAMLRAVISNSQSAIYVKDLDGRYLLANETFQAAYARTEAEIIGLSDDELDPELGPTWRANDLLALGGPVHMEEIDSEGRVYESNKFPLYDTNGQVFAVCGVSLDVTSLRRATAAAEHARDEALAESQVKSEFLATMSHEIRTPMNGVLGLASLLMSTDLDPDQRRYATGIHSAGNALLGVINDILDFSKIEAGKVVLDPDDFDLPQLITETAGLIAPPAEAKGLIVVTRRSPQLPATVRGDGGRVRQILLNLAGNAVKFTDKGSVTIRAELRATPALVRFEIVDTGIGINPDTAAHLFEPFTQADASTTRTYGGTGLGLAISRQLTEAMGGTIGVDSEPGQGSTFWCEIPFEPPAGTRSGTTQDTGLLRILVTGTGTDRADLEDDLRRWQMTVAGTDTAPEALDMLRDAAVHGRPFDLLLVDADAADVDTAGLARLIAADDTIPTVQIIVLNENPPEGDHEGRTYLPKPVHRSALYDLLAQSMAAVVPVPVTPVDQRAPVTATRGTVLLVEDNDINQMVAVGILTSLGYSADVAGDGARACEMAMAQPYDAILMDCRMPRMDGFTATTELRRHEEQTGRHIPIIAMTASALVADRERCLAAGMDDYLAKPVNPVELEAALHRWINNPVRAAQEQEREPVAAHAEAPAAAGGQAPMAQRPTPPGSPADLLAPHDDSDSIGRRLAELAGDRTGPEIALVRRLVTSFLARAPHHVTTLTDAFNAGDTKGVEDQAHSLKGAAGNIGALAVMDVCERIENDARARTITNGTADDLRRLRHELARVERRLRDQPA